MCNVHKKSLITGTFHTKDEKELEYKTIEEYENRITKKQSTVTYSITD